MCKFLASSAAPLGAVKAWIAFMIATNEIASRHRVDLDTTIKSLADTGRDMGLKYKETSKGGLAVKPHPLLIPN